MSDLDERELQQQYAEINARSTAAIGQDLAKDQPMVEMGLADEQTRLRADLLSLALKLRERDESDDPRSWQQILERLESPPGQTLADRQADFMTLMRRSLVRVDVSPGRIPGEHRHTIEKARHWLEADLRLPDLVVEWFGVRDAIFDQRDGLTQAQADLGKLLETRDVETCGYVAHAAQSIANLRADQSLPEMLEVLVHEARHVHQLTTSVGSLVQADRRERDAQNYTKAALPRLRAALKDR